MTTRNANTTAYLFPSSPIFGAYRVPLFDELHNRLGDDFLLIAERQQRDPNSQIAVHAGHFPRLLLNSRRIDISRRHDDALETPFGVTLTPGLLPALLRVNPKAVISNNFSTWTMTALMAGYPTILFWEGTAHTERTVTAWRLALRRWIAQRATAFVTNGTLSRRYLVENLGVDPELVVEGGMGPELPPPHLARNTARERPAGAPLRFLLVGRLVKLKGVATLVRAAAALRRRVGDALPFEIHILGDGPERGALEQLTQELGIASHVTFLGAVLASEVWRSYAEADVFVLPTFQDNWPLVAPEAMFMAMPILLSRDSGSTVDLVLEGQNGFAFNPADHEQLASLMEVYLRDPEAVRQHGAKSREMAGRYTPQRVADAYLAALQCVPGVRDRQHYANVT
ncbi:glycosyltransferase family 4 protein [Azospirillum sp. sgz301742]